MLVTPQYFKSSPEAVASPPVQSTKVYPLNAHRTRLAKRPCGASMPFYYFLAHELDMRAAGCAACALGSRRECLRAPRSATPPTHLSLNVAEHPPRAPPSKHTRNENSATASLVESDGQRDAKQGPLIPPPGQPFISHPGPPAHRSCLAVTSAGHFLSL